MASSPTRLSEGDMEHDRHDNDAMTTEDHGLEVKTNLKRLREASAEPQTPNASADDPPSGEHRERKAPVTKKNRLDSLTEQELESPPRSPPLNHDHRPNSPPEEMRTEDTNPTDVQQIREKVHDLNWQEPNNDGSPPRIQIQDEHMHEASSGEQPSASHIGDQALPAQSGQDDVAIQNAEIEEQGKVAETSENAGDKTPVAAHSPPPPTTTASENDTTLSEEDEHAIASAADNAAVPVPVERPKTPTKPILIARPRGHASAVRRRGSDSLERECAGSDEENIAMSPSRKRKLFTRESTFGGAGAHHEEQSKRLKDDESKTALESNEVAMSAARHTTPPVLRSSTPPPPPAVSASVPKPGGFTAWSGASPFATMGGLGSAFSQTTSSQPKTSGFGGFAGFMSNSSPFANVASSSASLFGAGSATTTATATQPLSRNQTPEVARPASSHPSSPNRSRSPSSSSMNRKKSPQLASAKVKPGAGWGTYNGGSAASFGDVKRHHSPSPSLDAVVSRQPTVLEGEGDGADSSANGNGTGETTASWREMLGTSVDASSDAQDSKKMLVEEIELTTGEEHEVTRHQVRARLFQLDPSGSYKERGLGMLRIKVRKADDTGARIVMRADAVHRVILNAALFRGMSVSTGADPKYVRMTSLEEGKPVHYAIRVANARIAEELLAAIEELLPAEDHVTAPTPAAPEVAV
ncbi:hypothetical protein FRB93_000793 [Tulasnella sp. JGI-2019a]|nr:hypothetical protein FRB93_000793 [Tulasnella sp. JGI-2019a]